MAAVLILIGSLLLTAAAGLGAGIALGAPAGVAAGMAVAGGLSLWFGVDAARDVLPAETKEMEPGGRLRAVGDGS
jgi:hypothetical protein